MVLFVIASSICFVLFYLLVSIGSDQKLNFRRFSFIGGVVYFREDFVKIASYLIVFVMGCTLSYLLYFQVIQPSHRLYGIYDFITSRETVSISLGIVFGGLFALWLRRIYKKEPAVDPETGKLQESFTLTEKLEGGLLLILFVLGTTTYTIKDLISGVQIDSPIVKFQLENAQTAQAVNLSGQRNSGAVQIQLPESWQGNPNQNLKPALLLKYLHSHVQRDTAYFEMHNKPFAKRKKTCENKEEGYEDLDCERLKPKFEEHDQIISRQTKSEAHIEELFTGYFDCLNFYMEITQDEVYSDTVFASLLPKFRQLYWMSAAFNSDERVRSEETAAYNELIQKSSLVFVEGIVNSAASVATLADIAKGKSVPIFDDMNLEEADSGVQSCRSVKAIAQGSSSQDPDEDKTFVDINLAFLSPEQPYFALIYAFMLAHVKDYETAIITLDEWSRSYIGDADTQASLDVNDIKFWYLLRVRSIQILLYKDWKTGSSRSARLGSAQMSPVAFNEYINILESIVAMLRKVPAVKQREEMFPRMRYDGVAGRTLEAVGFLRQPKHDQCGVGYSDADQEGFLKRLLASVYFANVHYLGLFGMEHPEYKNTKFVEINEHLAELVNTDLSCLVYAEEDSAVFRSEVFRAYGLARVKEIHLRDEFAHVRPDWLLQKLELSVSAFRMSKKIIFDYAVENDNVRLNSPRLKTRLDETHAEWVVTDVNNWIDNIEKILRDLQR